MTARRPSEAAEILDSRHPGPRRGGSGLSRPQKAAIVVRVLLADGARMPLAALPDHIQAALTQQIGAMRLVDRATLKSVVDEFTEELEEAGLAFPSGIEGAISLLDGHISVSAANRLRRLAGVSAKSDPWERILNLPSETLLPALEMESVEVGAVMLSKLSARRAAELLEMLPGEKARRIAHAMGRTGRIDPQTVRRIGMALAAQMDAQPSRAFEDGPDQRMGAILNSSPAATREAVLQGLEASDPEFAGQVRRAIFTFEAIPARMSHRDVPKVLRQVERAELVRALKAARIAGEEMAAAAEFLLSNLPQRMAESLREEMSEPGDVAPREGEAAMTAIVTAIRAMESAGELTLVTMEPADQPGTPLGTGEAEG